MSAIYFHQKNIKCGIRGSERAWFSSQIFKLFICSLSLSPYDREQPLFKMCGRQDAATMSLEAFTNWARFADFYHCGEQSFEAFGIQLNTAIAMGADVVKLAARIDGQCEVHGYFEEEDRAWLKGLVQDGLKIGFFNRGQGWEGLLDAIDSGSGEIVMSFSVCDGFPGGRDWSDAVREIKERGLRIGPNTLGDMFEPGVTGYQLAKMLRSL